MPSEVVVEIEYVPEKVDFDGELNDEFRKVIDKFYFNADSEENDNNKDAPDLAKADSDSEKEGQQEDTQTKEKRLSNKRKKLQRRLKIAELKKICTRPDVVEAWDTTASDPKLLVFLKSYRNTVVVPRHWCQKRKYLHGKRGIEKKPFRLPDFIAATGIEKIRQVHMEKAHGKKLKQKERERIRPNMGNMDIDYQVLHDAFFKHQTKPKLTTHGDLYYEGKEFEVKPRDRKPGMLSQELREALGMTEGAPPPHWLVNMQRFVHHQTNYEEEPIDKSKHWGDLEEQEVEELLEEEELEDSIQSVDSLSSTPTSIETPDNVIELRKQKGKEPERPLYQVLEQKEEKIAPGTLLGTSHTYVINTRTQGKDWVDFLRGQRSDQVEVTLAPEELDSMYTIGNDSQ